MWELGKFVPESTLESNSNDERVKSEFQRWVSARIVDFSRSVSEVHVRPPDHEWALAQGRQESLDWHSDGTSNAGRQYLLTWSNGLGTEITRPKSAQRIYAEGQNNLWDVTPGEIYRPDPYSVYLFDNKYFKHRTPLYTRKSQVANRWFIRTSFYTTRATQWRPASNPQLLDVPGIYALETE